MSHFAPGPESIRATHRHELGILLVHGIGRQRQGDTLRSFGLPLSRWLERWLCNPERTWLEAGVTSNALDEWLSRTAASEELRNQLRSLFQALWAKAGPAPVQGAGKHWQKIEEIASEIGYPTISAKVGFSEATPDGTAERSHASLDIRLLNVSGGLEERRWLVAESWWAASFRTPSYWQLLRWSFVVVPWAVVAHFARRLVGAFADVTDPRVRSGAFEWARLLFAAFWLVASPAVALISMATLVILGVPALTSIPFVGSWVEGVQRTLVETIGDSFVFTEGELDTAQIKTPVTRDLEWLAANCDKVAVIAHSQGAAVAYDVLLERARKGDAPVDLFLTFGSGLRKLHELRTTQATTKFGYKLGHLVVLGLTLGLLSAFGPFVATLWPFVLGVAGLTLSVAGLGPIFTLVTVDSPQLFKEVEDSQRHSRSWEDLYASHDPVSNGKLFFVPGAPLVSRKVHNRASVCTDHTSYWANFDHFVGMVIQELSKLSGLRASIEPRLAETTGYASLQREWRVGWLQLGRAILAVLFVAVAFRSAGEVPPMLARSSIPFAQGHLPSALAAFAIGIVTSLFYFLLHWTWQWWDLSDVGRLFDREPYEDRCVPFLCFAALLGAATGTAAATILLPWTRNEIGNMLLRGAVPGVLFGALAGVAGPALRSKRSQVRAQQTRRRGAGEHRP